MLIPSAAFKLSTFNLVLLAMILQHEILILQPFKFNFTKLQHCISNDWIAKNKNNKTK